MEFCEKLQELRKSRGLTQEELAEILYVSRTAISKWESGRGLPSIDSLKGIAAFFSVSIDSLLSAEKLIVIAEKEKRANICDLFHLLFGMIDILSFVLIVLPLYPKAVDGHVYSVSLPSYVEVSELHRSVYWAIFLALILLGVVKVLLARSKAEKLLKILTIASVFLSMVTVVFLALAGETYAVTLAFLLMVFKGVLLLRFVTCSH